MRLLLALLATVAFGSVFAEGAPAPAGEGEKHNNKEGEKSPMGFLKHLDANKDGELSADELAANKNEKLAAKLTAADTNKDGKLDKAELEALKAHLEKHEGEAKKEGEEKKEGAEKK